MADEISNRSRAERRYDESYAEEVELRDGTLRLVQPTDKALFVEAFGHLSPRSIYQRFLAAKNRLSKTELAYLTELDHEQHLAILAVRKDDDGAEHGLGVARFVVLRDEPPGTAEVAITVIDEVQHLGLGTLLLQRLALAARERGVARFRFDVLGSNAQMMEILRDVAPGLTHHWNSDFVDHLEIDTKAVDAILGHQLEERTPGAK